MSELEIGSGVTAIGDDVFSYVGKSGGAAIDIVIPGNVKTLGNNVFANSVSIRDVVFEEGVESLGNAPFLNGMIERVYIPASLVNVSNWISGSNSVGVLLEYVVAEGNSVYFSKDGILYQREINESTGGEKIILVSFPENKEAETYTVSDVDEISAAAFGYTSNISTVNIIGTEEQPIKLEKSAFVWSKVEYVNINEYATGTLSGAFHQCRYLKKAEISDRGISSYIDGYAFYVCSSLQEFTVTENIIGIGSNAFASTYELTKFTYDAATARIVGSVFGTSSYPRFDLIIGEHVNDLLGYETATYQHFPVIASRADTITFVGENQITVEEGALEDAGAPLGNISGTIWVDAQGVVYLYDAETMTAKVIYVSPGIADIAIPEAVTPEENLLCTVNAIGSLAFQKSDVTSVTFQDASKIIELESKAFANCTTLTQIIDEKSAVTATTVINAEKIFTDANPKVSFGTNVFYNTGLTADTADGEEAEEDIPGKIAEVDETTGLFVTKQAFGEDNVLTISTAQGPYLTGQQASTTVTFSNAYPEAIKDKVFRIYFSPSEKDCTRSFDSLNFTGENGNKITLNVIDTEDGSGTYYVEFKGADLKQFGATLSFAINNCYPSPATGGGDLLIWTQIYDSEEAAAAEDHQLPSDLSAREYQKITWNTEPALPLIKEGAYSGAFLTASKTEGRAEIHGLSYAIGTSVAVRSIDSVSENVGLGLDYITNIEYESILTLPESFYINPDIRTAIEEGNYYRHYDSSNGTKGLYTMIDGEKIEICSLNNAANAIDMDVSITENGLKVTWNYINNKVTTNQNTQIAAKNNSLVYGPQLICADMEDLPETSTKLNFDNEVILTASYTHTDVTQKVSAAATRDVEVRAAVVALTKKLTETPEYYGEDVTYVITMKNTTAFAYPNAGMLQDILDSNIYIKPEALEEMFADEVTGKELQIVISNANIIADYTVQKATASDGNTEVSLTPDNSGTGTIYDYTEQAQSAQKAAITLQYNAEGVLTIKIADVTKTVGEGCDYRSIDDALAANGFFISADTIYTVNWLYRDCAIPGNTLIDYVILGTIKDSFMLCSIDRETEHFDDVRQVAKNTAQLYATDGTKIKDCTANGFSVVRESIITGSVSREGKALLDDAEDKTFQIQLNDILDYTIKFTHHGTADYEVLPFSNLLSGAQQLMVPAALNAGQDWAQDHEATYGDEAFDEYYYILTPGNYNGVWINDRVYADSVTVEENGQNGWNTLIKLYYSGLSGEKDYAKKITYKTLVDPAATGVSGQTFNVQNIAWANDLQGYRLYSSLLGEGSVFEFGKEIVVEKGSSPESDHLDEDEHSYVMSDSEVTYRLEILKRGTAAAILTGAELYDALPNTREAFAWGDENTLISISYMSDSGVTISTSDGSEWEISDIRPGSTESESGQQFICWDDDFTINFSEEVDQSIYIYVTLKFPQGNEWDAYFRDNANKILYNTMYLYEMGSKVSHELGDTGRAVLQKGVYKITANDYDLATDLWKPGENADNNKEIILDSRKLYSNTDAYLKIVTYYTVLYNSGNVRLYLNDLVDQLPENFRYEALTNSAGEVFTVTNYIDDTESAADKLVTIEGADFVSASVTASISDDGSSDGHQRLRFKIAGGDLSYDSSRGKYYLNPGEAVRFGYLVSTGKLQDGVSSTAQNTIAMAYDDYMGLGIKADYDTVVSVADVPEKTLKTNDGKRQLWGNTEASAFGFSQAWAEKWLVSQVSLEKGDIIPGIVKNAVSYIDKTGTEKTYEGHVDWTDTVVWKVRALNEGQIPIKHYVLSDVIEAPYKFTGNIGFDLYRGQTEDDSHLWEGDGNSGKNYLFRIIERKENDAGETIITVVSNNGNDYKLTMGEIGYVSVYFYNSSYGKPTLIKVLLEEVVDDEGKVYEKLSLICDFEEDPASVNGVPYYNDLFAIPEGGMAVLTVSTVNESAEVANRTYVNRAYITPLTQDYDDFLVTNGVNGLWDEGQSAYSGIDRKPYIENSALVTVANGYYTSSEKAVSYVNEESEERIAKSRDAQNNILIDEQDDIFTYELIVNTPEQAEMKTLTLIDNLPYVGDSLTYASIAERNSEFQVNLAQEPDFEVVVVDEETGTETKLDAEDYVVSYRSTIQEFTSEDKAGAGSGWTSYEAGVTDPNEVRSLRVYIDNSIKNEDGSSLIPANTKVVFRFNGAASEGAKAGAIAWNDFGYTYSMGDNAVLSSAPDVVGVRFPSVPVLRKELETEMDKSYTAKEDETFRFIVYTGEVMDFTGMSEAEIYTALTNGDTARAVAYVEIPVTAGESESESIVLNKLQQYVYDSAQEQWIPDENAEPWKWVADATYSVAELPMAEESLYNYKTMTVNGISGSSFRYAEDRDVYITAVNVRKSGNILLLKHDEKSQETVLADAVFALYSPLQDDQMTQSDISAAGLAYDLQLETAQLSATETIEDVTYYLADIQKSNSYGMISWEELFGDRYFVKELKAPNGYNLDETFHEIVIDVNETQQIVKIANEGGYELPQSGGMGVGGITLAGAAAILISGTAGINIAWKNSEFKTNFQKRRKKKD